MAESVVDVDQQTATVAATQTGSGDLQEDGRSARRERNRVATVDAMLELYDEGNLAPSSDQIAERAGLSPRSLFRYFEDLDDLTQAAIVRQQERVLPHLDVDVVADAPFAERVGAFVEQRIRLFEAMGAVGQVARLRAWFQPLVATQLTQGRRYLRRQIGTLFATELARLGPSRAADTVAMLDVVFSFEAHRLMRDDQKLSRARCAAVLADTLVRLLTQEDPPLKVSR